MSDENVETKKSEVHFIGAHSKAMKADTSSLVVSGASEYPDDAFDGLYLTTASSSNAILEPNYKPGTLHALCTQNNVLMQCVEAMEVNIDGTGHSIELIEGRPENAKEKQRLVSFFTHPYPKKSFVAIRRALRRDIEATGNGYLEVLRNGNGEVMLLNHVDAVYMRLVKLDKPQPVTQVIERDGKPTEVSMEVPFRRYVQFTSTAKRLYFKEFGAPMDLDRNTGEWEKTGSLPLELRAAEIMHFTGNKEPKTPYGTPRWINQLPSVLGSRKAEEHNLEFFDAGGVPPVLIIVQGGTLGTNTKEALEAHLSAKTNKHRAAVVEAVSTSGSLDSAGAVQVRVERFGSERQQDAMFQKYDLACEDHVRVSFRLPPLFLGKASDYNFATAYTAYMIAEAQVFAPERTEFDNYLNETIVTALGVKSYRYRSLPMTLTDVANQLKAIEIVTSKFVSGEEVVKKLNEVTGLSMQYEKQAQPINLGLTPGVMPQQQSGATATIEPPTPESTARQNQPKASNVGKQEISGHLIELAERFSAMLEGGVTVFGQGEQTAIKEEVAGLSPAEYDTFATLLANNSIEMIWTDQSGLEELCACAGHLVTP